MYFSDKSNLEVIEESYLDLYYLKMFKKNTNLRFSLFLLFDYRNFLFIECSVVLVI